MSKKQTAEQWVCAIPDEPMRMFEFTIGIGEETDLPEGFDGGCCNSDWLYVYATSRAEALRMVLNHEAGLCPSCMMDTLVQSRNLIGNSLPEEEVIDCADSKE